MPPHLQQAAPARDRVWSHQLSRDGDVNGFTYWHSRGCGLHAINPFGVSDFLNDKSQNGSLTLAPGAHARFRYRVVIHQGASRARIAELYEQYALLRPTR